MLTEVKINTPGDVTAPTLSLPIGGRGPYPIQYIDGLSPSDAEIATSKYAIVCGEHFEGSRVNVRNIVLTLELVPSYADGETVEGLRGDLYRYFRTKEPVDMTFVSSIFGERKIRGYVESFEAPLFVDQPAAQISILCPNPYFLSVTETEITHSLTHSGWMVLPNGGDISTGVEISVLSPSSTSKGVIFTMESDSKGSSTRMEFERSLPQYFTLIVDSNSGRKTAIAPDERVMSMLGYMTSDSEWMRLWPGENLLNVNVTYSKSYNIITAKYTERFIGL